MPDPLVAIIGAPNVGKSTLFNRLVGTRQAIVTDEPGVTRDRLYGEVSGSGRRFRLIDTGGLMPQSTAPLARDIERQAQAALQEAAVVLLVVDARAGITAVDRELAAMLHRRGQPVLLVANKVEGRAVAAQVLELHELGLGEPVAISAEHDVGIDELLGRLESLFVEPGSETDALAVGEPAPLDVALVGRPNVGKSSILNRLAGQERVIVSELPGTTRDSIDVLLALGSRRYRLIDTAGIRRPGKLARPVERFSVVRARRSIERSDVAVLVLDAAAGLAAQDAHIAGFIRESYKPMVVAVNKWDLVEEREAQVKSWEAEVRRRLRFAKYVPIVFISARTGQRVIKLLDHIDNVHATAQIRVPTTELNRWLHELRPGDRDAPPPRGNLRLLYATQTGVHPPSFLVFCNDPRLAHFSLRRQLENQLRERFGFGPAPVRLVFRGRRQAGRS